MNTYKICILSMEHQKISAAEKISAAITKFITTNPELVKQLESEGLVFKLFNTTYRAYYNGRFICNYMVCTRGAKCVASHDTPKKIMELLMKHKIVFVGKPEIPTETVQTFRYSPVLSIASSVDHNDQMWRYDNTVQTNQTSQTSNIDKTPKPINDCQYTETPIKFLTDTIDQLSSRIAMVECINTKLCTMLADVQKELQICQRKNIEILDEMSKIKALVLDNHVTKFKK